MTSPKYPSPDRFKQALEAKIRTAAAAAAIGVARFRQRCIFERFLARIVAQFGDRAVLKGGVALALSLARARVTRDVDLPPITLRVYAREVHVAEKLHAYTLPRPRENTRVKDLPDLVILGSISPLQGTVLLETIRATFAHRASHEVPPALPVPPASWERPYADMAQENDLPWTTLADVFAKATAFLDPVLSGGGGAWDPDRWTWSIGP